MNSGWLDGGQDVPARLARAAAMETGHGLFFVARDESITRVSWEEVYRRARVVAGGLRERGLRRDDCVALVLPTGPAFFDAFFGVQLAGGIPVPLYPPFRLGRLREYEGRTAAMLAAVRARMVLTDARIWPLLGPSVARARPPLGCVDVADVAGEPFAQPARPGDLALVQFSSGTTVEPKPIALTHAQVLSNAMAVAAIVAGEPVETHAGVSWLPLYHDMGLVGCVLPALCYPGSLTLIPPELFVARPAVWLRTLSRTRAPVSPAPNFAYALCVDRIRDEELEGVDLSAWRLALNGAEPVAPGTLRRFCERFARWGLREEALTPVYGLAEAALAVTFSDWRRPFRTACFDREKLAGGEVVEAPDGVELVSVGRPLPGFEVDAPTGRVGPIRARGPSVMAGYLHQPERTAAALRDGWLHTGDLGFFHRGELYVAGREKDVIVIRGRNHAPHEIEQALDGVPGIRTGCVAAVGWRPEDADTEELVVFAEARGPVGIEACRQAVLGATGLVPARVILLSPGALPRTSSGKIRRGEALRRWRAGRLDAPSRVSAAGMLRAMARGVLAHWRLRLGGG